MESHNHDNTINCVNDNESWYSAVSKRKSLKIVLSPHKRSKFNLTKITFVYIHYTANIVLANSFF